jgi:hypothetical protein
MFAIYDQGRIACLAEENSANTLLEDMKLREEVSQEAFTCQLDEAMNLIQKGVRSRLCQGPQKVSKARWFELLEVLFPARRETCENCEVFTVPELHAGNVYLHGVRIDDNYFIINEDYDVSAEDLIRACREEFLAS